MDKKVEDITFHYTKPEMAYDLIQLIPFDYGDTVMDAGSGKNKVWYNAIPSSHDKYECEIEDGTDFLEVSARYDWIIGNPPFHLGWKFTEHSLKLANKGIAFLGSINFANSELTPKRLKTISENGFYLNKIHVVSDKRWFGRYFFFIWTKTPCNFISYANKNY